MVLLSAHRFMYGLGGTRIFVYDKRGWAIHKCEFPHRLDKKRGKLSYGEAGPHAGQTASSISIPFLSINPQATLSVDIPIGTEKGKEAPLDYRLSGLGGQIHEEMHIVQAV